MTTDPWRPQAVEWSWQAVPVGQSERVSLGSDALSFGVTVVATVLLGAPLGLLWAHTAPRAEVVASTDGIGLVDVETKAFIAADGWFLLLTAIAGLVCGVVAYRLARQHGAVVTLALVGGGLLAAYVAWKVGHRVGLASFDNYVDTAASGQRGEAPVNLRAHGALLAWPFAANAAYGLLLLRRRD